MVNSSSDTQALAKKLLIDMWPPGEKTLLMKREKEVHWFAFEDDPVLFVLLPGRQVQCGARGRQSTIYFYQHMQDFGGIKYTFVQLIK